MTTIELADNEAAVVVRADGSHTLIMPKGTKEDSMTEALYIWAALRFRDAVRALKQLTPTPKD